MDEAQLVKALDRDDSYRVIRTLAETDAGRTELVRGPGAGLLVRKYVARELANEHAWRILADINHPLLPQVRDLYWLPDSFVVVTTYVDGITLGELVESTGPLEAVEAVRYVADLCEAAGELHAHGIVHRDISPGNAVVASGRAALIDLGNVRAYVEGAKHDTTTLGTWGFAAPEQFGFAQTDARSDVYALGGLLAYLLTGVKPGDDRFDKALANQRLVSHDLRLVVQKARAFEPSARFQTAAELADAAGAALPKPVTVVPMDLDAPDRPKAVFEERPPKTRRTPETEWETVSSAGAEQSNSFAYTAKPKRADDLFPMRIIRWFFPALPTPRRTWAELRHLEKSFVVLLWTAAAIVLPPLSLGFFNASVGREGIDAIAVYIVSVIWTITLIMLVREVHLLVTCLGPRRNVVEAIKLFAIRTVVMASFCLALSVVAVLACFVIERLLY